MAIDKSEPRSVLVLKIGVLAIGTVVAMRALLFGYFDRIVTAEEYLKVGASKPEQLLAQRADDKQRLVGGAMPIDQSMKQIAAKGRAQASPDIAPQQSKDPSPIIGWAQAPGEVPEQFLAPPPAPPAPSGSAAPAPSGSAARPPLAPSASAAPAPKHP